MKPNFFRDLFEEGLKPAYSGVRYNLWKKNKERILKTASSDLNERVKALIYIKHNMILHCGEKPKAQADWIHQERVELSGFSAWECLTSGDLAGIDAVAHYINRVIG